MEGMYCMCGEEPTRMTSKSDGSFIIWTCSDCDTVVREWKASPTTVIELM